MTLLKILVFSDSHRYTGGMIQAIEEQQPDLVVHLGDLQRDAEELALLYPKLSPCPATATAGPQILWSASSWCAASASSSPTGTSGM